jgi:hypothetical protein
MNRRWIRSLDVQVGRQRYPFDPDVWYLEIIKLVFVEVIQKSRNYDWAFYVQQLFGDRQEVAARALKRRGRVAVRILAACS